MKVIKTNEITQTKDLLNHPEFNQLVKYAQIIPAEMLAAVQSAADARGTWNWKSPHASLQLLLHRIL